MIHALHDDASVTVEHVRHLLANLDDAAQLRCNPLLADRLERFANDGDAVAVARALVLTAVNSMRAHPRNHRLHQIALRCGINGEPRKQVAYDLAISVRQLHRDVHVAYERLAAALTGARIDHSFSPESNDTSIVRLLQNAADERSRERRLSLVLRALEQITQQPEREEKSLIQTAI